MKIFASTVLGSPIKSSSGRKSPGSQSSASASAKKSSSIKTTKSKRPLFEEKKVSNTTNIEVITAAQIVSEFQNNTSKQYLLEETFARVGDTSNPYSLRTSSREG